MTKAESKRLDSLAKSADRSWNKFFEFLQEISPRNWGYLVPVKYIREELTYEDAVTKDELSCVPPCAFNSSKEQLEKFAGKLF